MSLQTQIMEALKMAMKEKDTVALESLRAVKSALLLAQTESGAKADLTETEEIKLLQKLVKQRKDSAAIFTEQGRNDLAEPEIAQANVIEQFLPKQLSEAEVEKVVVNIIAKTGASSMADMGKVMGELKKQYEDSLDFAKAGSLLKELLNK